MRTPIRLISAMALLGASLLAPGTQAAAEPPQQAPSQVTTTSAKRPSYRVLVFTKNAGQRRSAAKAGVEAIRDLGRRNGFSVEATEDASRFTDRTLKRFRAVVFLNTTGEVLNADQQAAFERNLFNLNWAEFGGPGVTASGA